MKRPRISTSASGPEGIGGNLFSGGNVILGSASTPLTPGLRIALFIIAFRLNNFVVDSRCHVTPTGITQENASRARKEGSIIVVRLARMFTICSVASAAMRA
jgi:hypothetical protein